MLNISNTGHVYSGAEETRNIRALEGINLTVHNGEFLCIIGPSGSGKSTLLDLISGFIEPSEGTISLDDQLVTKPGPDRGVVFQEPNLFPWLTVLENVAFGLLCQGAPKERADRVAREMLALVGLEGFAHFHPHELSGGMKQRASIARVLAFDPRILLMDEPFCSLDAQTRRKLQDELLYIWGLKRKTIVFVTHNVEEAVYLADRVVVLCSRPGKVKADIPISMPRPRTPGTSCFQGYRDKITNLIEN